MNSRFSMPPRAKFVAYSAKIADVNEADVNDHTIDMLTVLGETRKVISVLIYSVRVAGSGFLGGKFADGAYGVYSTSLAGLIGGGEYPLPATGLFTYKQTVANDDFDVYCEGYYVEV